MQDKDLDKLVKQRFDNFEMEPTTDVWNNISNQLEGKKAKKRDNSFFLKVAACIAVILSAYLWVSKPQKVVMLQGKSDKIVVVKEPQVKAPAKLLEQERTVILDNRELSNAPVLATLVKKKDIASKHFSVKSATPALIKLPVIALALETKLDDKPNIDSINSESLIAQNNKEQENFIEEAPRKKMKNIGGLVNFVISKVDPRRDKIIEFKEGDEGPEISGINLGLLKLKARNKGTIGTKTATKPKLDRLGVRP